MQQHVFQVYSNAPDCTRIRHFNAPNSKLFWGGAPPPHPLGAFGASSSAAPPPLKIPGSATAHIGAKPGKKPLLGNEIETKLVDYAVDRAAMGVGFGEKQFIDYATRWPANISLSSRQESHRRNGGG